MVYPMILEIFGIQGKKISGVGKVADKIDSSGWITPPKINMEPGNDGFQ